MTFLKKSVHCIGVKNNFRKSERGQIVFSWHSMTYVVVISGYIYLILTWQVADFFNVLILKILLLKECVLSSLVTVVTSINTDNYFLQ